MNILFYKLLSRNELLEQAKYIQNARDLDYALENSIRSYGYNPIEKLKELEDDIDSQLMIPEICELLDSKTSNFPESLEESIEFFRKLDAIINERFKFYGIFILKQILSFVSFYLIFNSLLVASLCFSLLSFSSKYS